MGFEVRLAGGTQLDRVVYGLRRVGDQGLGRIMSKQLRAATAPLRKDIKAEVPRAMPSGYAPILSKSLRFRQQIQTTRTTSRVTFRVHADGQRERRDVPTLNRGRLRHPLWGDREYWVDQRVRRGFVDRPIDRWRPEIRRQMDAVVAWVASEIGVR